MSEKLKNCHDCGAEPGEVHSENCDTERCSVCGCQRLGCGCEGHDRAFSRWTGLWPGEAEVALLGTDLNGIYTLTHEGTQLFKILFVKPKTPVRQPNQNLRAAVCRRRGDHQPLLRELAKMPVELQLELFRLIQDLEMEVANEKRKRKQGRVW